MREEKEVRTQEKVCALRSMVRVAISLVAQFTALMAGIIIADTHYMRRVL